MKRLTQKNFIQKLIVSIICVLLLNFCLAPSAQAASFGGKMMEYIRDFATAIGDVMASIIQFGVTGEWYSATIKRRRKSKW